MFPEVEVIPHVPAVELEFREHLEIPENRELSVISLSGRIIPPITPMNR